MSNTFANKIFRCLIVRTRMFPCTCGTTTEISDDAWCATQFFRCNRLATVLSKRSFKCVEEFSMVKWHNLDMPWATTDKPAWRFCVITLNASLCAQTN